MGLADPEPANSLCLASGLVGEVGSKVTGKVRGSFGLGAFLSVSGSQSVLSGMKYCLANWIGPGFSSSSTGGMFRPV